MVKAPAAKKKLSLSAHLPGMTPGRPSEPHKATGSMEVACEPPQEALLAARQCEAELLRKNKHTSILSFLFSEQVLPLFFVKNEQIEQRASMQSQWGATAR